MKLPATPKVGVFKRAAGGVFLHAKIYFMASHPECSPHKRLNYAYRGKSTMTKLINK